MANIAPPTLFKVASGITGFDEITNGGLPAGRTALVYGNAGCGKTLLSIQFLVAGAVKYDEPGVFVSFEESRNDLAINVDSPGYDLKQWSDKNLLKIISIRPAATGLEAHWLAMLNSIRAFRPQLVVIDPVNSFITGGDNDALKGLMSRLLDHLKSNHITAIYNNLTACGGAEKVTEISISSMMDSWLLLSNINTNEYRTHTATIIKSRGMAHSSRIHNYDQGIVIDDASR